MFSGRAEIDFPQFRSFCRYGSHAVSSSSISLQLRFFPVELLPQIEMLSSLKTMLANAFFSKVAELVKINLTEMLIVLNPPFRVLKHLNRYEISISRSLLDTRPYLCRRSAVPLTPQGPNDYGTCGSGEMAINSCFF